MVITGRSDLSRIKWNFTHRKCWMIGHVSAAAAVRAAHYVGIQVYVYTCIHIIYIICILCMGIKPSSGRPRDDYRSNLFRYFRFRPSCCWSFTSLYTRPLARLPINIISTWPPLAVWTRSRCRLIITTRPSFTSIIISIYIRLWQSRSRQRNRLL